MNKKQLDIKRLINISKSIRLNVLDMVNKGNSSHIASVFSMIEILVILYEYVLKFKPSDPNWNERDRLILSKGHAGAGIYAILAEYHFFDKKILNSHYQDGSLLSGHVSHIGIPGVEISTGSLGHGLSIGCGMALAAKTNNQSHRVYVILSDGECNEGSVWESIMFANHHGLNNLTVIIDRNKLQSIKNTEDTLKLEPFDKKWKSFGWNVININGHDYQEIFDSLNNKNELNSSPLCIIANTIKGKGVSFMENNILWHYRSPQNKEYDEAKKELLNER